MRMRRANHHRQYMRESVGKEQAEKAATGGIAAGEKISTSTLDGQSGQSALNGHGTPEERFWLRQHGQAETIAVGKEYIAKVFLPSALTSPPPFTLPKQFSCGDGIVPTADCFF